MSAGTGITHSEFHASNSDPAAILQIWVLPKVKGIKPRYGQKYFPAEERENQFQTLVSPDGDELAEKGPVWINQDAYFSLGKFEPGKEIEYKKFRKDGVLYLFLILGKTFRDRNLNRFLS